MTVRATWACKIPPPNDPGPSVIPPAPPTNPCEVCPTPLANAGSDDSETEGRTQTGGESAFCPMSELQTLGWHTDYDSSAGHQMAGLSIYGMGGCSSCGSMGELPDGTRLPGLVVSRRLIPCNQVTIGNCSPGWFFTDFDLRLVLYEGSGNGSHPAILFDPDSERCELYTDAMGTGTYLSEVGQLFGPIELLQPDGQPATGPCAAAKAIVTRHNGWVHELEVCSVPLAPGQWGTRVTKITSPDGVAGERLETRGWRQSDRSVAVVTGPGKSKGGPTGSLDSIQRADETMEHFGGFRCEA